MEPGKVLERLTRTWAPALNRSAVTENRLPQAESRAVAQVRRHDHHNIEIKAVFEVGTQAFDGELDVFLFVPRTFDLHSWGKQDLEKDVRSRMRLAIPEGSEQGIELVSSSKATLAAAIAQSDQDPTSDEQLLEAARELCSVTSETLKQWSSAQARSFLLAHMVFSTTDSCLKELTRLRSMIERAGLLMKEIRSVAALAKRSNVVLTALDEFLSYLYVQYLGTLRSQFDKLAEPPPSVNAAEYVPVRAQLERCLNLRIEEEANYRRGSGWCPVGEENDVERERRLVRMSQLKKFFQSRSFVEISRRPAARRVSESTALAGTALAGLVAAFFQRFNRPDVVDAAFQGFFIICFGVVAYVLRDRLKDWAKARFHEHARKYLPDYEQILMARERKIGEVKEWYQLRDRSSLPLEIRMLRQKASAHEMELRLPEDVFHFRKKQELNGAASGPGGASPARALHENIRINFERYLKHMDDPFKEMVEIDPEGRLRQSRSHRVYHFYICVRACRRTTEADHAPGLECVYTTFHRIVLDKTGIIRLETEN